MTFETTGALVAAPTTSLPEEIGGVRNWDYRYCWLRDSVLALEALLSAGYTAEALEFRDYLLRVGTGDPTAIQIMYGIRGERRLTEFELEALPGYEDSKPVRVGKRCVGAVSTRRLRRGLGRGLPRDNGHGQNRGAVLAPLAGGCRSR
jgi:GH15 family glucan-1,4-alpha-glucosidase